MKENYPLFVKWTSVLDWILDKSEKLPKSIRFSLASRIADYALDIMEGIIEAIYSKEKGILLDKINLDIEKLRVLFRICHQRKYISNTQYEYISKELDETGKMVGGWKKSLP